MRHTGDLGKIAAAASNIQYNTVIADAKALISDLSSSSIEDQNNEKLRSI